MKIYNYNPITMEYAGDSLAELSPLDKKQGRDVWLIPANATAIEPPEAIVGKIRVFVDGAWSYDDIPTPHTIPEPTEEEVLQMQINDIKRELRQLDVIVPRIVEDILEQGNFTIHQSKLDIIARKVELRDQLANLEVGG